MTMPGTRRRSAAVAVLRHVPAPGKLPQFHDQADASVIVGVGMEVGRARVAHPAQRDPIRPILEDRAEDEVGERLSFGLHSGRIHVEHDALIRLAVTAQTVDLVLGLGAGHGQESDGDKGSGPPHQTTVAVLPQSAAMTDTPIPNVLAGRYASLAMRELWSPRTKVILERQLWIAVMEAQRDLGLDIPADAIESYRAVVDDVDLESIAGREAVTRHDVKARIEEFCALAGSEHIHKGMTSRDATENVEQLQIRRSLELVRDRCVAVLGRLAERAAEHADQVIAGRTHNVPAQAITLGKRFANAGEELLLAYEALESLLLTYPLRGLKGPVGTQQDLLDLFDGDEESVAQLEGRLAELLGFERIMSSVGQVYPRSLDFAVVSTLLRVAGGPASLAVTIRLMAGADLASEGFREGQVGSSAMPHKMNSRSSERIAGFVSVLTGHVTMAASLVGTQWGEGDVSDSVVRRVVLPDAFFTVDGVLETALTILDEFTAFPDVIDRELQRHLPFLATTALLMEAVRSGVGRETAHARIREHAVASAAAMRTGTGGPSDLFDRVRADTVLAIDAGRLDAIAHRPTAFTGRSMAQIGTFVERVAAVTAAHPDAAGYTPGGIL